MSKKNVLFICTHNSARSQMAEGLLQTHYGAYVNAYSAGLKASRVKSLAIAAMKEVGIDISGHRSKALEALAHIPMDYVVTVCDTAREACPYVPARVRVIHKGFPRPSAGGTTEAELRASFRRVRDEIKAWLDTEFIPALLAEESTPR